MVLRYQFVLFLISCIKVFEDIYNCTVVENITCCYFFMEFNRSIINFKKCYKEL